MTTRYTSITYKQTLVNFRTTFVDDNTSDMYEIIDTNIDCDVNDITAIEITEENLRKGFLTDNCAIETPSAPSYEGEGVMIAAIRLQLNRSLTTTFGTPSEISVKKKLLDFINSQDNSLTNRILWTNVDYNNVVLKPFAEGLVGTDLALTTYDIVTNDVVNFIFRFSGGPRSVDGVSPSYYTVKIPFVVTAIAPVAGSADTALPA
jgi:hypothetical protein